ncbi:hypothetical protein ACFWYW_55565 [Nonomuraea sp. NPDC059023]|uniref:hypothetical protein n=1 Tax=unclassified Nonomuraea TaxID=2593643 RepID=UPI00367CF5EB
MISAIRAWRQTMILKRRVAAERIMAVGTGIVHGALAGCLFAAGEWKLALTQVCLSIVLMYFIARAWQVRARRSSDQVTVVPADVFDDLEASLEEPAERIEALAEAARKRRGQ